MQGKNTSFVNILPWKVKIRHSVHVWGLQGTMEMFFFLFFLPCSKAEFIFCLSPSFCTLHLCLSPPFLSGSISLYTGLLRVPSHTNSSWRVCVVGMPGWQGWLQRSLHLPHARTGAGYLGNLHGAFSCFYVGTLRECYLSIMFGRPVPQLQPFLFKESKIPFLSITLQNLQYLRHGA